MSEFTFLRYGHEIMDFMSSNLSNDLIEKMNSVSGTRAYCYLRKKTWLHYKTEYFSCYDYKCRLKEMLKNALIERKDQRYLIFVHLINVDDITDEQRLFAKILIF